MSRPETTALSSWLLSARKALLEGDIAGLADLVAGVDRAMAASSGLPRQELASLRSLAEENARLLEAALKGVRSAKNRARDLTPEGRFSTYGAKGKRYQHGLGAPATAIRL